MQQVEKSLGEGAKVPVSYEQPMESRGMRVALPVSTHPIVTT